MSSSYYHHHQGREDGYYGEACEGERVYSTPPYVGERYQRVDNTYVHDGPILPPPSHHHRQHHQNASFQRNERLGELGAVAAGAFALYEGYKATNDKEHASKHMQEAGIAGLAALGSGGYALYEHRQKEKYSGGGC